MSFLDPPPHNHLHPPHIGGPSTRLTVRNFLDALESRPYLGDRSTTILTSDATQQTVVSADSFLADSCEIRHPLMDFIETQQPAEKLSRASPPGKPPTHSSSPPSSSPAEAGHAASRTARPSPTAAQQAATKAPSASSLAAFNSMDDKLRLLQRQERRTHWGALERGPCHERQVVRLGYSYLRGFRGEFVQVFELDAHFHITSIYVRLTKAPWRERWWWFRRRSVPSRRLLWQAWWEEWELTDEERAAEELAFQQRLLETNFFAF